MQKIKVLIVEDKLLIAQDIAARLLKHNLDVVGMCTSGEEAIQKAATENPDLILMDIELDGAIDGISAAKIIQENQSVPIIFLSDYQDARTLDRAKKTQPANYITKPFLEPDLIRAIDLAFSNARQQKLPTHVAAGYTHVFLRTQNQAFLKLSLQSIVYLEAERSYCKVITDDKTHTLTNSMNHVFEQLPSTDFMKVHRSYCINLNRITELDGNVIKMGKHEVQMSREYRDDLIGLLKIIK